MKDKKRKSVPVEKGEDANPQQKKPKALSQRMETANSGERLTGSTPKEKEKVRKKMDSNDQVSHDVDDTED